MARQHRVRGEYQPEVDWTRVTRSVTVRGGLLEGLAFPPVSQSKCFKKGNDFLKRMMMFLRCYGWIYFPLSLFLFWVFRLSFVEFLLRQILYHIKALRTENVENTCTVDINSVYFRFYLSFSGLCCGTWEAIY